MHDSSFGQWLKQQRRARDLTQDDLARGIGCAAITIRKIEAGTLRPSRQVAERLADLLAIAPDERAAFIAQARGTPQHAPANRAAHPLAPPTALIGREREIAAVRDLLADARLLTLTGPPGVGKTRLCIQVATDLQPAFSDGVTLVALAPIRAPALVAPTIARAFGIKETASRTPIDGLCACLRDRQLLLALDNFEQVIDAAPLLTELLAGAPRLRILVTSRILLRVSGEHEFVVPPLALPPAIDQHRRPLSWPSQYALRSGLGQAADCPLQPAEVYELDAIAAAPAVQLFAQRARAAKPSFALTAANANDVAAICAHLDGLPLAIELAAGRIKLFRPAMLLTRLSHRLAFLTQGARDLLPHQQTLRNALEWSYDLLDAHEQALFTRLGVFVGGCTFEAAEAVCGVADCTMQPADCEARSWISDVQSALVDGLAALVDKSLLQQTETAYGEPRLAMLETIREYALERLQESGAMAEARKRHAQFFLRLAEQLQPKLHESEQRVRHETDLDNFRAALAWLAQQDDPQRAYRLWSALWPFWWTQGLLSEGRRWLVPLLARRQRLAIPDQSAILNNAGWLAYWQGDYMAARNCWEDVLALAYASGNMQVVAKMGIFLSMTAEAQGEYETARSSLEASLSFFRKAKDKNNIAVAQLLLGGLDRMANQTQQAAARFAESLALHRELGNTWHVGILEFNQGFLEQQLSNHARAGALLRASLAKMQDLGDHWGISHCLRGLAGVAAAQNQPEQAARLFGATEALLEITGLRLEPFEQSEHDQHIAVARAQLDKAAFAAAWAAGRTMPLEQAIAEALGH